MDNFTLAGELLQKNFSTLSARELAILTEISYKCKSNWDAIREEWGNRAKGNPLSQLVDNTQIEISYKALSKADYKTCANVLSTKQLKQITKYSVDMTKVKALELYDKLVEEGAITESTSLVLSVKDAE